MILKIKNFVKNEKPLIFSLFSIILIKIINLYNFSFFENFLFIINTFLFFLSVIMIIYASKSIVSHSEKLAIKYGEPYGTIIFTLSTAIIEVVMISTMMLNYDPDPTLARDTIYFTVIIFFNGFIGLSLLSGGLKYREQKYNFMTTRSYQSMIVLIIGLTMFLPIFLNQNENFPYYMLIIISSIILYIFFLRMQTISHKHLFVFDEENHSKTDKNSIDKKNINGIYHLTIMLFIILSISILGEFFSKNLDYSIYIIHLSGSIKGLIIALILSIPEAITIIKSGWKNDIQRTFNISLGSVLSTIALTVPIILFVGLITGKNIVLGVTGVQSIIIILTLAIAHITNSDGKTNPLDGLIQLILFIISVLLIII